MSPMHTSACCLPAVLGDRAEAVFRVLCYHLTDHGQRLENALETLRRAAPGRCLELSCPQIVVAGVKGHVLARARTRRCGTPRPSFVSTRSPPPELPLRVACRLNLSDRVALGAACPAHPRHRVGVDELAEGIRTISRQPTTPPYRRATRRLTGLGRSASP